MSQVARAFAEVARILRMRGRRLDRALVQSTWKWVTLGLRWKPRRPTTSNRSMPRR